MNSTLVPMFPYHIHYPADSLFSVDGHPCQFGPCIPQNGVQQHVHHGNDHPHFYGNMMFPESQNHLGMCCIFQWFTCSLLKCPVEVICGRESNCLVNRELLQHRELLNLKNALLQYSLILFSKNLPVNIAKH